MKRVSFNDDITIHEFYRYGRIYNKSKKEIKTIGDYFDNLKEFFKDIYEEIKYKLEYIKFKMKRGYN